MRWLSLDEVAAVLGVEAEFLERLLMRAPAVLPGAVPDEVDGWRVPESALRVLVGARTGPLPQFVTVADIAQAMRRDVKTVYGWLQLKRPGGKPLLPSRWVIGLRLVDAKDVLALPARLPSAPASFFCAKRRAKA